jgi:hypothetical protein
MNGWYDRQGQALDQPSLTRQIDALNSLDDELRSKTSGWGTARVVALWIGGWPCRGRLSLELVDTSVMPHILHNLARAEPIAAASMTQNHVEPLAVALSRYRADQGRWPAKLDELAPQYARSIPQDVFTDKPLVYMPREDGYLLYSVGRNLRDDGGRSGTKQNDDIVARVPADANEPSTRPQP